MKSKIAVISCIGLIYTLVGPALLAGLFTLQIGENFGLFLFFAMYSYFFTWPLFLVMSLYVSIKTIKQSPINNFTYYVILLAAPLIAMMLIEYKFDSTTITDHIMETLSAFIAATIAAFILLIIIRKITSIPSHLLTLR